MSNKALEGNNEALGEPANRRTNFTWEEGVKGLGMLITDQHTSLFLSSAPLIHHPDRLASWWCILSRSFSSVSSVASRFVLERPIAAPVSLHAGLAWDRRVDPTTRSREEIFLLPSFDLPFALPPRNQRTRFHDVSAPRPPSTYHHYPRRYPTWLWLPTGNRPSVICTTRSTNLNAFRASYAADSSNQTIDAGLEKGKR